jgi:hypothetical protein
VIVMTDRRGDPGFSVAPRRIGDDPAGRGRRRMRRIGVSAVLLAAVAVIGIAWLGPRITEPPHLDLSYFATPTPGASPSAGAPSPSPGASPTDGGEPTGPTPLPDVTRNEGPIVAGGVAIAADGLRVLDLASGRLEKSIDVVLGSDAVVRAPDDRGWSCVCFVESIVDGRPVRVVRVAAIDPTGAGSDTFDVLTLPASYGEEFGQTNPLPDVDIDDDGRTALLAIATRTDDEWSIEVAPIDLDRRLAGERSLLGAASARPAPSGGPRASGAPAPTAPPAPSPAYLDGPHVRLAPGGRVAFVWAVAQTNSGDAVVTTTAVAWRVALGPAGQVEEIREIDGFDDLPVFCSTATFAAADRLAWFCPEVSFDPNPPDSVGWTLGTVDLDGRAAGSRTFPIHESGNFGEPLVDRANGFLYAWDPTALVLTRLDVHTLTSVSVTFDRATSSAPGIAPGGGVSDPEWRDIDSAVELYPFSQVAGSPDGKRLYLLGFEPLGSPEAPAQGSLGILVVDRATLALVDRWAPAADYFGLSVDRAGQVLATGLPGVDADGASAPWQGSLTVHDPADGRILVRYGQLGQDVPPLVFDR